LTISVLGASLDTIRRDMPVRKKQRIAPEAAKQYAPADGSSTVAKIAAD